MQNDPEKTLGNYNEFRGVTPFKAPLGSAIEFEAGAEQAAEQQEIVQAGLSLVNSMIDEILGAGNKLTRGDLTLPEIEFIDTLPEHPTWSGYFSSYGNKIGIITGNIKDRVARIKVFVHEYIHFLSHNGHDDTEQLAGEAPIAQNNNVGFRRMFGLDIRRGKEDKMTSDYFLAWNEGVDEQLAIDILPGVHETYPDYRGLLNQAIDDAVTRNLGSPDAQGSFQPWSRGHIKNYIYRCFLKGDLAGFTQLLQTIYDQYDISEQQFGLMTHRDDLPSVIESSWSADHPNSPPPSPHQVAVMVQERLDRKTPDDYVTDLLDPEPGSDDHHNRLKYGAEYDIHIRENNLVYARREIIEGRVYDVDSHGYFVYHDEEAALIFEAIRAELDDLLLQAAIGAVDALFITERMDELLFHTYRTSMLSDGFRDFYIYKHSKIDNLQG